MNRDGTRFSILTDEHLPVAINNQLTKKGVENERAINVLPEGTPDPELLAYAHTNGFALLTHDEAIKQPVMDRNANGEDHTGVFIAPNHLQGVKGIGTIVNYLLELDQSIKGVAATSY